MTDPVENSLPAVEVAVAATEEVPRAAEPPDSIPIDPLSIQVETGILQRSSTGRRSLVEERTEILVVPKEPSPASEQMETVNLDMTDASDMRDPSSPCPSTDEMLSESVNDGNLENGNDIDASSENTCKENEAQSGSEEMPKEDVPDSGISLRKYFDGPVAENVPDDDTTGRSFFDSLSSGLSPMMKSVSEIAMLQDTGQASTVVAAISEAEEETGKGRVDFSVGETPSLLEEVGRDVGPVDSGSIPGDVRPAEPTLRQFFDKDCVGHDVEGKAFFDVLAGLADSQTESAHLPDGNASDPIVPSTLDGYSENSSPLSLPESGFLASLDQGNSDWYRDLWMPSETTRQMLVAAAVPGNAIFPDKDQLTVPGVVIKDPLVDPVRSLMNEMQMDEVKARATPTADSVSQDKKGLHRLISAGCYHAAVNLTTSLLTAVGQGPGRAGHPTRNTPYSLQLWFTRIALLLKLRKFALAEIESQAFADLDKPDLYYEFYPELYNGKKGSMVPFTFRLLLAELPQYQGNHQSALDKLYGIQGAVCKIIENLEQGSPEEYSTTETTEDDRRAALKLWKQRECRVLYSILNCVLSHRDYVMAIAITETLLAKDTDCTPQLYSALGRIYLQLGDVAQAQECFAKVTEVTSGDDDQVQVDDLVNKAMMSVAHSTYSEAYDYYHEASLLRPGDPMLLNNMAVCLLYMGKLKESLALLESTVRDKPAQSLHEGVLFNICTLYELESSHSTAKKRALLALVAEHIGDNFHTASLKIQIAAKT